MSDEPYKSSGYDAVGPRIRHWSKDETDAKMISNLLNVAYAAGRASREAEVAALRKVAEAAKTVAAEVCPVPPYPMCSHPSTYTYGILVRSLAALDAAGKGEA